MLLAAEIEILDEEDRRPGTLPGLVEPGDEIDALARPAAACDRQDDKQDRQPRQADATADREALRGQRRRSFTAARVSRSVSRRFSVSRLSCAFLPLASEIATFT